MITFAAACLATVVINESPQAWNERDNKSLKRATYVCKKEYGPRGAPCLKRFIKKEPLTYWAICGGTNGQGPEIRIRLNLIYPKGY